MKRKLLLIAVVALLLSSCVASRPVYKKGDDMEKYHTELKKHQEKKQRK
jgi:outer membrane biogenesis lipoprotein LolB